MTEHFGLLAHRLVALVVIAASVLVSFAALVDEECRKIEILLLFCIPVHFYKC